MSPFASDVRAILSVRAESLHAQICEVLRNMLDEPDIVKDEAG